MITKSLTSMAILTLVISLIGSSTVSANHTWGKYHWDLSTADTITNPLKLGNNLKTPEWDNSLIGASADWNRSVLKNRVVAGESDAACSPTAGQVEVCNSEYGSNGWLGIAQIWATRGRSGHITQGAVLLNDTYFNTPPYNTAAWRNMVTCQEVGHTFGLGHQDENFSNANLDTCMDYTSDPESNQQPNSHDYDMMAAIYEHLNSTSTDSGGSNNGNKPKKTNVRANIDINNPSSWGVAIKQDAQGNNSVYEKILSNGTMVLTHVTWIN